jgi:phosphoglycolate phosphatase
MRYAGVFFDLDGTLLDTAPDLASALNAARAEEHLTPLPFAQIRPHVSNGARALVLLGFPGDEHHPRYETRRQRLLAHYRENICQQTQLFAGMDSVLRSIEESASPWGVVTNKPAWLTEPLLQACGLSSRVACIVSGDTIAQRKPLPAPLLHAATMAGVQPDRCVYIGDARRDAEAAHAAGMSMLAAAYGYIEPGDDPWSWGAEAVVAQPTDILTHLQK